MLVCGLLYPRLCARDRHAALSQLDALITLAAFIRRHIEFYRLPVKDILLRCDSSLLSYFGGEAESLSELFERTRWLDGEVEAVALSFASSLGRGYYSEQLRICDATLSELSVLRDKRAQKEGSRRKTEGVLSLGTAVLAVILLL